MVPDTRPCPVCNRLAPGVVDADGAFLPFRGNRHAANCVNFAAAFGGSVVQSTAFAWMSNPQYLAQVGHFLGGAWVVFLCGLFGGETIMLWGLSLGILLAGLKEFVFDVAAWGEGDSWSDSAMDFAFYLLGGMAGLAVFALAEYAHRLV